MQKLVFINGNGTQIDLTAGNFGITNWAGLSNTGLNIQSQQVPFQDGGVFLDALIEQRELSVTLAMQDNNNLEERYRMRRELIHILNPKLGEGYLIYTNDFISKRIKCVAQIPLFETHNSNDSGTPKASLAWTACEPYWEDLEETIQVINSNERKIVVNNGDIPCQINGEIVPVPSVKDIVLKSLTNEKEIGVSGTVENIINISTETGKKQVIDFNIKRRNILLDCDFKLIKFIDNKYCLFASKKNVSNASYLLQSENLSDWEITEFDFACFQYVAEKDGLFVGVNNTGYIYFSTNLKTWNAVNLGTNTFKVIYVKDKGKFYAFGTTIYSSEDGENWETLSTSQPAIDYEYYQKGGYFLQLANSGESYGTSTVLSKSDDCVSWTSVYTRNHQAFKCLYTDTSGLVLIGGASFDVYGYLTTNIFKTTNLSNWSSVTIDGNYSAMKRFIGNGTEIFLLFSATGNSKIFNSFDGSVWDVIKNSTDVYYNYEWIEGDLIFAGAEGVIGSLNGNIQTLNLDGEIYDFIYIKELKTYAVSVGYNVYISKDLRIFKKVLTSPTNSIHFGYHPEKKIIVAICYGGNNFYSYNLEDWIQNTDANRPFIHYFGGVKYIPDLKYLFAFGMDVTYGCIYYTEDGVNWNKGSTDAYFGHFQYKINDVAYSDKLKRLVLVCNGQTYSCDDLGHTWELRETSKGSYKIIYNKQDEKFYFGNPYINYSNDGYTFITTNKNVGSKLYYQEETGKMVCYDYLIGKIYIGFNVFNWKEIYTLLLYEGDLKMYGNNIFIFGRIISGYVDGSLDVITQEENENIISKITPSSNMTFNLEIGNNILLLSELEGDATIVLKYRQKYIGV